MRLSLFEFLLLNNSSRDLELSFFPWKIWYVSVPVFSSVGIVDQFKLAIEKCRNSYLPVLGLVPLTKISCLLILFYRTIFQYLCKIYLSLWKPIFWVILFFNLIWVMCTHLLFSFGARAFTQPHPFIWSEIKIWMTQTRRMQLWWMV